MTAQPTDADRARAEALCTDMPGVDYEDDGTSWREKVRYVAQALADTRQPFLDLADELDKAAADLGWARGAPYADAADQIRAAAGTST